MTTFQFVHLRAEESHNRSLVDQLRRLELPVWGMFSGLFGIAANEVYLVTTGEHELDVLPGTVVASEPWQPTARPTDNTALTEPGLYVFRRLPVPEKDVDELVSLSQEAWTTFENTSSYATRPVGLFRPPPDADGVVNMQLVTWYDGFESWEVSRTPASAAAENFKKRSALTLTTSAVALRLVG